MRARRRRAPGASRAGAGCPARRNRWSRSSRGKGAGRGRWRPHRSEGAALTRCARCCCSVSGPWPHNAANVFAAQPAGATGAAPGAPYVLRAAAPPGRVTEEVSEWFAGTMSGAPRGPPGEARTGQPPASAQIGGIAEVAVLAAGEFVGRPAVRWAKAVGAEKWRTPRGGWSAGTARQLPRPRDAGTRKGKDLRAPKTWPSSALGLSRPMFHPESAGFFGSA